MCKDTDSYYSYLYSPQGKRIQKSVSLMFESQQRGDTLSGSLKKYNPKEGKSRTTL